MIFVARDAGFTSETDSIRRNDIDALAEKAREVYEQRVVRRTEFPPWSEVSEDWRETFRQMVRAVLVGLRE